MKVKNGNGNCRREGTVKDFTGSDESAQRNSVVTSAIILPKGN